MLNNALNNQRLFSFCLLIKVRQKNSVVFLSDNRRKQASKFGMALDTFNKYLKAAIERKILIETGNNLQLISINKITELLLLEKADNFYKYIHSEDIKVMSIHQLTNWVRECLVLRSFNQQKHQIIKTQNLIATIENILNNKKGETLRPFKKFAKKAHQLGLSVEEYLKRVKNRSNKVIVSGCDHLSSKIGNCKATANKALNSLVKKEFIKREIKIREFKEYDISNASFDAIKAEYGTNALFIKYSTQHFIQVIGSEITLLESGCFA